MTCNEFLRLIDAYLDGELSVADTLQAHEHLALCDSCRRILTSEAAIHTLVGDAVRGEEIPAGLRDRVRGRIEAAASQGGQRTPRWRRRAARLWLVAGAVVVAALGWFVIEWTAPNRMTSLTAELASKHLLYSEEAVAPLEFVTSEPARLGTWLEHRLGFAVRLPSLARRPERLIGGRISSVADAPAAYVLYDRGGHPMSLFVTRTVPRAKRGWTERHVDGAELYLASLRGVALAWWEDKGEDRVYAAASAAGAEELVEFALLCINSGRVSKRTSTERRATIAAVAVIF
ncbi:MAG: hypothetical protein AUI57_03400 [Candidatus Rokubacteria bacterium 13_1_40CM_2_68_8]|nr:MAG: hypothetical protein AUI57_03400 [Candidatus Rokubacteria bacterium 13_1_40CM_2_68_8]